MVSRGIISSCPLLHVLGGWARRVVRRSEVALVERAHLIGCKRADDRMQDATVVEHHEVFLVPVMRVNKL